jgi:ABC-type uncharacterized transport system substrate-binding protein
VPDLGEDRYMAPLITAAAEMVETGALIGAVDLPAYVLGRAE